MKFPRLKRNTWTAILFLLAMCLFFGSIAEEVVTNDTLVDIDRVFGAWIQSRSNPSMTDMMLIITQLGASSVVLTICAMTGVLLWRRHLYHWLTALILSVPGGMLFNLFLKILFRRARPLVDHPVVATLGYSFPSGHTMAVTVLYGFLVILAFSTIRERALPLALLGLLLITAVAFSRVYLGAHYLSDVLGAFTAGLAWLTLSFKVAFSVRRRDRDPSHESV